MNLNWTKVSTVAGGIIAVSTIAAALGYGLPWAPAALSGTVVQNHREVMREIHELTVQEDKNSKQATMNSMRTERSIQLMILYEQNKTHDRLGAAQTQAYIKDLSAQIRNPH